MMIPISVLQSGPRTAKRLTTRLNFYWLQPDCSCGPGDWGLVQLQLQLLPVFVETGCRLHVGQDPLYCTFPVPN